MQRYKRLGDEAKAILRTEAIKRFEYSEVQFYRRLQSDRLSADELVWFAQTFDCSTEELYNKAPKVKNIEDLEKERVGAAYHDTKALAKDLGLSKRKVA